MTRRKLEASTADAMDNRGQLLLAYLSAHERKLTDLLEIMESEGDIKALQTWCYDYLRSYPIEHAPTDDKDWSDLSTDEIMVRIENDHNRLIDLYRHLRDQVDTDPAQALVDELLSLEQHDAMAISQGANRLNDL